MCGPRASTLVTSAVAYLEHQKQGCAGWSLQSAAARIQSIGVGLVLLSLTFFITFPRLFLCVPSTCYSAVGMAGA